VRCTAVVHIILLQRRKVVKRAHGRRTNGDGGETETAVLDRDGASEKYLVVPLMETVYNRNSSSPCSRCKPVRIILLNLRWCVCVREVTYRACECVWLLAPVSCEKRGKGAKRNTDGG